MAAEPPCVLLAATEAGLAVLHAILHGHARLRCALSLPEALALAAERDVDLVLCTFQFAESQMFEFLRLCQAGRPELPFVCCRVLNGRLERGAIAAARHAAVVHGAAGYLDLPVLLQRHGAEEGGRMFRDAVLAHCVKQDLRHP